MKTLKQVTNELKEEGRYFKLELVGSGLNSYTVINVGSITKTEMQNFKGKYPNMIFKTR